MITFIELFEMPPVGLIKAQHGNSYDGGALANEHFTLINVYTKFISP